MKQKNALIQKKSVLKKDIKYLIKYAILIVQKIQKIKIIIIYVNVYTIFIIIVIIYIALIQIKHVNVRVIQSPVKIRNASILLKNALKKIIYFMMRKIVIKINALLIKYH